MMLEHLKAHGKTLVILSNGTTKMLENGIKATQIHDLVDVVLSVDTIQVYKPDPRVYQMALRELAAKHQQFSL